MPWTSPADQTTGHVVTSTEWNQVVDDLVFLHDKGGDLASAATLPSPVTQYHVVTGTTTITSIPLLAAGCRLVLLFTGVCMVTSGGTLKLRGDFGSAVNDTLSLISDGTNWYETGRSNVKQRLDFQPVSSDAPTSAASAAAATALITGNSVAYDGTPVRVKVFFPAWTHSVGGGFMHVHVWRDAADLGEVCSLFSVFATSNPNVGSVNGELYDAPAPGLHTYKAMGWVSSGTGTGRAGAGGVGVYANGFLLVERAV